MKKFFNHSDFKHPLVVGIILLCLGGMGFLVKYYFFDISKSVPTRQEIKQELNNTGSGVINAPINGNVNINETSKPEIVYMQPTILNTVINTDTGIKFKHEYEVDIANAYTNRLEFYILEVSMSKTTNIPNSGISFIRDAIVAYEKAGIRSVKIFTVNFVTDYKINQESVRLGVKEVK